MILQEIFGFPTHEETFEKAIIILTQEYKLVNGYIAPKSGPLRVLVWEDDQKKGRYRVHLQQNTRWGPDQQPRDVFAFHYWRNERLTETIAKLDPMKEPLQHIKNLSPNILIAAISHQEMTIEDIAAQFHTSSRF
ncbi:MAG: hypothetical protein Q7R96_02625 [Nanoarchaeota archaeon]|nr:hypothetical protein [Nanoarchaeota archaeon]